MFTAAVLAIVAVSQTFTVVGLGCLAAPAFGYAAPSEAWMGRWIPRAAGVQPVPGGRPRGPGLPLTPTRSPRCCC